MHRVSLLLVCILVLLLSIRQIYGEDIGFHLASARWMVENFSFIGNDPLTYTALENKYIDLNWLYQLFVYGIYSLFGSTGLILTNSLLIIAAVLITFKQFGNSSPLIPWLLLLGILTISPTFEIRPHSFSWVLLSATLFILQKYYEGDKKIIRWLPAVMFFWVNTHSLFILGIAITGCYGISIFFKKKELLKRFTLFSLAALACCLLNPYGWNGFLLPFEQLFALQEGNIFKEGIRELQSPFSITEYEWGTLFDKWHFFDLFVLAAAILIIRNRKMMQLHDWLISILFSYFAFSATKNIGYMVFALLPLLGKQHAEKNHLSKKKNSIPWLEKHSKTLSLVFISLSFLLALSLITNSFYIHYRTSYRFGLGWSNSNLPVKAVEFLQKNNIKGKILNQLDHGGYIEFFTGQRASIDGRLDVMGEKIFDEQVNAVSDENKTNLISKHNPDLIIFSYFSTPDWIVYLQKHTDWRLAFADETSALYFKNGFSPEVQAFREPDFITSLPSYPDTRLDDLAMKGKNTFLLAPLFSSQYYPEDEFNRTAFCFYYGWEKSARLLTTHAFEKATDDYPELYLNAGTIYFQEKNAKMSLFCYEKYLVEVNNPKVEERVGFLKTKIQ